MDGYNAALGQKQGRYEVEIENYRMTDNKVAISPNA
jgi:hypothetical protein